MHKSEAQARCEKHCRSRTVPKPVVSTALDLSLERKQMPQLVETLKTTNTEWSCWKEGFFAQGRWLTFGPLPDQTLVGAERFELPWNRV